ncbi:hypothetical protein [Planctopirus hydrillae]|uniref:Uncharacterized protein n=1 Tax=Planctopirus hydrillae TaxID=1841610 RepID=A0A1C3EN96_9PLAN|nr:hypothetical protein [Planctopirus hydrillae]ODA34717.1 hypothetical protein A6X21_03340 [Planctopirus hydrillae]
MFTRMALALAGLAIAISASGCCCSANRCNPCGPCGAAAPSPCSTGNCSPSFYPPAGGGGGQFYQGADASGMNLGTSTVATSQPFGGYPATAMAPAQLLPN